MGEAGDPAGDPEHKQHGADHDPSGGDLARPQAAGYDHGRNRLHRLHWQRQAVKQAGGDQKRGEAAEHTGRRKTGDGQCPNHVRDEGAEVAAGAGQLLYDRVPAAVTCMASKHSDRNIRRNRAI
jgi:hypothetical protein